MLKVLSTLLAIRTSSMINLFFYYIQKLPVIGRLVKNTAYANTELKSAIAALVFGVLLLWSLAAKLLYLYFLFYLPVTLTGDLHEQHGTMALFVHMFVIISFIVTGVSSANVLEPKREKYIAVKLMRMSPKHYMHAFLSYRYIVYLISYIPALLLFVLLLKGTVLQAILLAVSVTGWRVLCEYLHLKLYEKTGTVLIKKIALVWTVIIAGYIAAYLPLFVEQAPMIGSFLLHSLFALAAAVLGAWSAVQLARYPRYREAVDAATKRDDPFLNVSGMIADANKSQMQVKESDYAAGQNLRQESYADAEGYAYLNAIFFARHRSLVTQPANKRLAIIAAVGILGSLALFVAGRIRPEFPVLELQALFPYLPVAMSLFTVGESTCRAMFYHCDISLTRYSFYRSAAAEHFLLRLRRMVGQNLRVAAALWGALTLLSFTSGGDILGRDLLLLGLSVLALAVFFAVHHLFLYYIFQPYSTDLNVRNPLYFVVSMAVSAVTGFAIFFPIPTTLFTAIVVAVVIIYGAAAVISVRRYGHRTFRVK